MMNYKTTSYAIAAAFLSLCYLVPQAFAGNIVINNATMSNSPIISGSNANVVIQRAESSGSSTSINSDGGSTVTIIGSGAKTVRKAVAPKFYSDEVTIINNNGKVTITFSDGRTCTVSAKGPFACVN